MVAGGRVSVPGFRRVGDRKRYGVRRGTKVGHNHRALPVGICDARATPRRAIAP